MKYGSVIGTIFVIGLFIFLKIFEDAIPKISEPITNTLILVGMITIGIIYGIIQIRKKAE